MAAQSLLARLGCRFGTLGSAVSVALAFPLSEGDLSQNAHTAAGRIGAYADRTASAEKIGCVVMGTEVLSIGVSSVVSAVPVSAPATTTAAAGLNLGQGTAPTSPVNGDIWITSAGLFARAGGATSGPFAAGGGSVTSVGLSLPAIFTVTNSPVTTSGTLTGTLATQSANFVWAGPTTGAATAPTFRALVTADLPAGTGTVTSVGLSLPAIFTVTNSPVTTSGTLTGTLATQTANFVWAGPTTGAATTPTFRALVTADIPAGFVTGSFTSGRVPFANGAASLTDSAQMTFSTANGLSLNRSATSNCEFFGATAGNTTTSTTDSTAIGAGALTAITIGTSCTAIGSQALHSATGGNSNTAIGFNALANGSGVNFRSNTAIGVSALVLCSTDSCVGIGVNAGFFGCGSSCVAIGNGALQQCTSGANNTAIGVSALTNWQAVSNQTAIGYQALLGNATPANNTGTGNSAIGYQALLVLSSGSSNTAIGTSAGALLTTGSSNLFLGNGSGDATAVGASNRLVAGSNTAALSAVYIGNGETNASPQAIAYNATGGSGANVAGASFTVAGGIGTGTGVGGAIIFRTALAGTTGSAANTLATRLSVLQDGGVDWTGLATTSAPALSAASHGTLYYDSTAQSFMISANGGAYAAIATGGIGGSAASARVAFGSGVNTLTSDAGFTWQTAAGLTVNNTATSSGTQSSFSVAAPATTGITASTENISVLFNQGNTRTWAAGAITTQREFLVTAPTYAFASASTITSAATVAIAGAPITGTNATITTSYALWVQSGVLGTAASTTTVAGLRLPHGAAPTSPVNGDIWTTSAGGLFSRINGVTQNYAAVAVANLFSATNTFSGQVTCSNATPATSTSAAAVTIGNGGAGGGLGVDGRSFLGTLTGSFSGNVISGVQDATVQVGGQVGEVQTATFNGGTGGSGSTINLQSLALTRGCWLIEAYCLVTSGTTGLTANNPIKFTLSTSNGTDGSAGATATYQTVSALNASAYWTVQAPKQLINISTTTTYYANLGITYGGGTPQAIGYILATRIR